MPEPVVIKLGVYIMPPEAISSAYIINPPSFSNTNISASKIVEAITLILELHNLYSSPSIIRMIKSRRMRWEGM
jgi:hypothetical protein